jgi:glucose/arabinose dehydrogenase
VLASGLGAPTDVDFAPDGRMFVVEKSGLLKVVTPGSAPQAATILDISDHVNAYGDRGLLGMAVAPDFAKTGHVYLLYTYEVDHTRQDGRKTSRLTRITVGPDNKIKGKERVIVGRDGDKPCKRVSNTSDCIPADAPTHAIGTVRADPDGTLWLGSGESTAYEIAYLDAFHAYSTRSFAGKLIHVDERGRGLPGHPYCPRDSNLTHTCTKLHAIGFRNPFRFTVHDGLPIVGDVGLETREEIDIARPGHNYGWPCYEGFVRTPAFRTNRFCRPKYAREGTRRALSKPLYDYPGYPGTVVVGPVLEGGPWPMQYRGRLFFGDYTRNFIQSLDLSTGKAAPFASDAGAPVDLEQAPDGNLAYVDIADGTVKEIAWAPANRAPIAGAVASRRS